jgi:two-component system, cell cycle response regulator DivK
MTPRVLIVDDNEALAELASYVLSAAGFTVETLTDSLCTVARALVFHPHLILMDLQMPGISGLELTLQLKADPVTQRIVVLAFTSSAMKGDEARIRSAGCDGYITKPFDVMTLADAVRHHLPTAP